MAIGVGLVVVGMIWYLAGDKLHWLGRLPGDIRVERPGVRIYIPLTTMLLLSVLIGMVRFVIRKWWP